MIEKKKIFWKISNNSFMDRVWLRGVEFWTERVWSSIPCEAFGNENCKQITASTGSFVRFRKKGKTLIADSSSKLKRPSCVNKQIKKSINLYIIFSSCAEQSFPGMNKICNQEIQHERWMVGEDVIPHCQPICSCQHFRK